MVGIDDILNHILTISLPYDNTVGIDHIYTSPTIYRIVINNNEFFWSCDEDVTDLRKCKILNRDIQKALTSTN